MTKKERTTQRVLIGKVGLDGHDVGARVVAVSLANEGIEVIYTGLRQTSEQIVNAAIEEAVDVIGISSLSGSHMTFFPEILRLLKEKGAEDIAFVAGGIIPTEDLDELRNIGVMGVFPPETPMTEIVNYIKNISHNKG